MPGVVSPATGLVKNANSTWLNGRPLSEDLAARLGPSGAAGQRRQLLRAVRGDRWRGGWAAGRLRRDPRHRRRRWPGRQRPRRDRRERDRGGVGAQPAAVARSWRVAGPAVLLRPHRMHRDVPLGARTGPGSSGPHRPRARRRRDRRQRRRRRRGRARVGRDATSAVSPAGSRRSSTCSIPTRSCSAAACRTSPGSTSGCRGCGPSSFSPTRSSRGSSRAVHGDSSGVRGAAWLWE